VDYFDHRANAENCTARTGLHIPTWVIYIYYILHITPFQGHN